MGLHHDVNREGGGRNRRPHFVPPETTETGSTLLTSMETRVVVQHILGGMEAFSQNTIAPTTHVSVTTLALWPKHVLDV